MGDKTRPRIVFGHTAAAAAHMLHMVGFLLHAKNSFHFCPGNWN